MGTPISCLSTHATGDLAHDPVLCLDEESNQQPCGLWDDTQPTEPHPRQDKQGRFGIKMVESGIEAYDNYKARINKSQEGLALILERPFPGVRAVCNMKIGDLSGVETSAHLIVDTLDLVE